MRAYRTVIVGLDLSPTSAPRAVAAVHAAAAFGAQRLHLVHVVHAAPSLGSALRPGPQLDPSTAAAVERAQDKLDALELPATEAWVHREVRVGPPARELARAAEEHHADLLIVARRGHNAFTRLVLGSVPNGLIRIATSPVLVVDEDLPAEAGLGNVLAAVDLSPVSRMVMDNAVILARAYGGEVKALSFLERGLDFGAEDVEAARRRQKAALLDLARGLRTEGVPLECEVLDHKGLVPASLVEAAKDSGAEVIVMGTSGRNAWHQMILGSTANHVLLRAPCAVLVVPAAAREEAEDPAEALAVDPVLGGNSPC